MAGLVARTVCCTVHNDAVRLTCVESPATNFQTTPQRLRKLDSCPIESGRNKTPGAAGPAVVAIASGN
jgi:hypothetical protein